VKLTFEGDTLSDIFKQIEGTISQLRDVNGVLPWAPAAETAVVASAPLVIRDQAHYDSLREAAPVEKPVDTPVEKPAKPAVSEKKLAAAAKMRAAKEAKANAKKAVKEVAIDTAAMMEQPPPPKTAEGMDPAEVVRVRHQTIEELQKAYANGFHREVRELLARFGNGAKSFRELPPESFVPIREAIDNGALT
jgi:hypothetical protein